MVGFLALRTRLIDLLRGRIRGGEITERGLARKAGISQPHLHNILKGVRALNVETGDLLMENLGIAATDLLNADELRRALFLVAKNAEPSVEVPVLHARVGPGLAWDARPSPFERVDLPYVRISRVEEPVVARLGHDPSMTPLLAAGDLVLLDRSAEARRPDDADALFLVERREATLIRWIRRGRGRLYLLNAVSRQTPHLWETCGHDAVLARATPLRAMYPAELVYDPLLPPRDTPPAPARR